ncbi:MAG: LytR C-terminal domain-containing protein [Actinomycetota bacterium]
MGRHSSPEQGPFLRSIMGWTLPWVMIAAVVLVAVWVAVDAVGGNDLDASPTARETATEPARETPTPEETEVEPTPEETPTPEPTRKQNDGRETALITEGITVQVLNGTGDPGADDRMAARLGELGFEVVAVEGSSRQYPETTVFWSFPEAREAAEALAQRFDWASGPKPTNLSSTVDLHVVVGRDET